MTHKYGKSIEKIPGLPNIHSPYKYEKTLGEMEGLGETQAQTSR